MDYLKRMQANRNYSMQGNVEHLLNGCKCLIANVVASFGVC